MTNEPKRGRGRPSTYLKPDARRIDMKIRWKAGEIEAVKDAAAAAGEPVTQFIRSAALQEAEKIKAPG